MRTITIANQKGGCGKTTTAVNTATALAFLQNRVLLVDLDSQCHSTIGLGLRLSMEKKNLYDAIMNEQMSMMEVITKTDINGLDLIQSSILVSGLEVELANVRGREYILRRRLMQLSSDYDICIIDCSPSLNLLTLNALIASTDILIPVQAHYYALEGLKQVLETIDIVKSRFRAYPNNP